METNNINNLVLAFLGDAVYEERFRLYLISSGINNVNQLQKMIISFVSAKAQNIYLNKFLETNFFSEEEVEIIKRGRNAKVRSHPKSVSIQEYKNATGLETLFGYLYLKGKTERINKIVEAIIKENNKNDSIG